MNAVLEERERLMERLAGTLGDLLQTVTVDAAEARPTPGHVAVLIEPPELEWPTWNVDPVITWKLDLIAGTTATQSQAADLLIEAVQTIAADTELNVNNAKPVTFTQPNGGDLAAYQLELNPLEF